MPLTITTCSTNQQLNVVAANVLDNAGSINQPVNIAIPYGGSTTSWGIGSGALQVNKVWSDVRTFSAAATTLDLTSLAAAATNIGSAAFSAIKIICITNNETTAGRTLIIGNAAATSFQGPLSSAATYTLNPGESFYVLNTTAAGWACGTNKNLKLDPGANNVSVSVTLLGN